MTRVEDKCLTGDFASFHCGPRRVCFYYSFVNGKTEEREVFYNKYLHLLSEILSVYLFHRLLKPFEADMRPVLRVHEVAEARE